jgi:CheY-like chemotaxis protein
LFRAGASEKGVALEVIVEDAVPQWIEVDPGRLRQVVLNIIANAVKFTRKGSVTVRLSSAPASPAGYAVIKIAVEDTGIGIAPEALPRLFKRFSQADQSIARQFGGTGLGLAIAKELIDLFGGDIFVESRLGQGSTFTIVFAAEQVGEPATRGVAAEMELPRLVPRNLRVLIAEDNEVNRLYVSSLLRNDGHSVDVVGNGAEAVAAVKAERYDLILMDLQMPILDGIAAAQAIRGLPMPSNVVPIIALTANASAADREAALAAGMNEHLAKPFNRAELSAAIRRACA